jgi:hypothetical protein
MKEVRFLILGIQKAEKDLLNMRITPKNRRKENKCFFIPPDPGWKQSRSSIWD